MDHTEKKYFNSIASLLLKYDFWILFTALLMMKDFFVGASSNK